MSLENIEHLTVKRILSNGQTVNVGQLASSASGQIYFSYDKTYLNANYGALSPLKVPAISDLIELTVGAFPMRERGVKPTIREAD